MSEFNKYSTDGGATFIDVEDTNGRIMSEQLIRDTVGWTGKNLAIPQAVGTVMDGNDTNGWKLATYGTDSYLYIAKVEAGKTYTCSKATGNRLRIYGFNSYPSTTVDSTARLIASKDALNEWTFTNSDNWKYITFVVNYNNALDLSTVHGMVYDARIAGNTYEPYHDTVSDEITDVYKVMGETGAKNLCPNKLINASPSGVTFTHNDDGTISLSGTATANADCPFLDTRDNNMPLFLKDVPIIVSKGFSNEHIKIVANAYNDSTWVKTLLTLTGEEALLTMDYSNYNRVRFTVFVDNGTNTSGVIVYPMIRFASDTDTTYATYTMTNRELTNIAGLITRIPSDLDNNSDMDDAKTMGIYGLKGVTTNIPAGETALWGILFVLVRGDGAIFQFVIASQKIFVRYFTGSWQSWYKYQGTLAT